MAQTSWPFENIDTTETQFSQWARNINEGIRQGSGSELAVTAPGGAMTVQVASGQAMIRGHYYSSTASETLTIAAADVTNPRIDSVVLELDPSANTVLLKVLTGTPAGSPVAPSLTQTDSGVYQIRLANVAVAAGALAISSGNLTDLRTYMFAGIGKWTTATRPANPVANQTTGYNTTINAHEFWDGTSWVGFADPITTEGDLIVGGASGVPTRLPIGDDDQLLTVVDGIPVWADAPSGSSNFAINKNSSSNNTFVLDAPRPSGVYQMSLSPTDTSYDVYFVTAAGTYAGYSNSVFITATAEFDTVVILGVVNTQIISFTYVGAAVNVPTEIGVEPGAGAYLTSISDSDLPTVGDTTILTGGNFANNVVVEFVSGAIVETAAAVTVNSTSELLVTRPVNLAANFNPWSVRVSNPGIPAPTGSNAHILTGITGGQGVTWVTAADLGLISYNGSLNVTLTATDGDGGDVDYVLQSGTLPTGVTLNGETGQLSGSNLTKGGVFTIRAFDSGNSYADREFYFAVQQATGGTITSIPGYVVHTFTSSGTFTPSVTITNCEYLVVAGGGGGGDGFGNGTAGSGGGAGGLRSSILGFPSGGGASAESRITVSTAQTVTVGAGGAGAPGGGSATAGSNSVFGSITSIGGGRGGGYSATATSGGSGGGATGGTAGTGTTGQGFNGGSGGGTTGGGGGGAGSIGGAPTGGLALDINATGTLSSYSRGGDGGLMNSFGQSGFGPGGGGGGANDGTTSNYGAGQSGTAGIVIVRYAG